jgi:hypothetical protein
MHDHILCATPFPSLYPGTILLGLQLLDPCNPQGLPGQHITLPLLFQQQQQQGALAGSSSSNNSSGGTAAVANVRVVDTPDVWSDPHNILLLAQAGATEVSC